MIDPPRLAGDGIGQKTSISGIGFKVVVIEVTVRFNGLEDA